MDSPGSGSRRRRGTWIRAVLWLGALACLLAGLGLLGLVTAADEWERSVGGGATTDDDDVRFTLLAVGLLVTAVALGVAARRHRARSS